MGGNNGQERLFCDDQYDAVNQCIITSGKQFKEIAAKVFPGSPIENAKSRLSRALSPDNHDTKLNIDGLIAILDNTIPDHFVYFLCDRYGFIRPEKKHELTPEEELKVLKSKLREMQLHEHPSFKGII